LGDCSDTFASYGASADLGGITTWASAGVPVTPVPDNGSTLLLLGIAGLGAFLMARKVKPASAV
jgi:hypothetical protein